MAGLVVIVVGTMFMTTVLVRLLLTPQIQAEFDDQLKDETKDTILEVRELFSEGIPSNLKDSDQFPKFVHILERRAKSRGNLRWFLRVFDGEHDVLYESEPLITIPPPDASQVLVPHQRDEFSWVDTPLSSHDGDTESRYTLQVGRSTEPLIDDFKLLNNTLLWRGLFVVALAPVAGYFFARQVTGPIATIIATASRLQPQQLDERLPIRGTNDELDRVSQTINRMLDRIAVYIDRNRSFVANAAHELRSPLAALRSSAEVALNRSRTPEEYATVLTEMIDEVGQLSTMVNRLLLLAESDAGRMAAGVGHSASLGKVVRESIEMFQAVAETVGVEIHLGKLPVAQVPCDEVTLRHLVRNLIDNAIKFTPAGKSVSVTLRTEQSRAVLEVADQGIGIPAEDQPRVFERFFRGDRSRHRDDGRAGTGLGLSICHAIATDMGGEIRVASIFGQGSKFTVVLPLTDGDDVQHSRLSAGKR